METISVSSVVTFVGFYRNLLRDGRGFILILNIPRLIFFSFSFYCPLERITDAELISAPPYVNCRVQSASFLSVTQHKFLMPLLLCTQSPSPAT